ncbi:hypothetical protein GCM10028807_57910 [Spirosoma daeguense]
MKKLLLLAGFTFCIALSVQAQNITKVTKITPATSLTGVIVLEDTTTNQEYLPIRRGDALVKVAGAATTARVSIWLKHTGKLIYTGLLTGIYVPLAGGNPVSQTSAQKLTYLKANGY